ncbi:hypothetical protein GQ457_01G003720 [Hibiscus cannabinus]
MVNSGSVEAASKSPSSRGFDLAEFPPLGEGQAGAVVAGNSAIDSGKSVWNLLDQSLQFFPPVTTNGRARKTADRLWGREGSVEIRFLAPSVYMINFPSRKVRDWVLESGPWHIQQKAIVLRRWMPGLKFDVLQLDSAPVWVKLWHVPATTLKQQLEFVKICIEVGAKKTISNSVLVELDEDLTVEIAVELVWSPPRCGHCSIFGHSKDNCSKKKVVEDGFTKVDGGPENNCDATVDDGRVNNGDAKEGLSCDDDGSLGVDSHVSSMVEMSSPNWGIPCVISGESLESPNKFEILCSVVEGQDGRVVSPRKVRAAAGEVADLMNQLTDNVKEVKELKGSKKKNQGKGGQKVKVNKGGEFGSPCHPKGDKRCGFCDECSFFSNCYLPDAFNSTIITLVLKVAGPVKATKFRPISCCNTVYKCITKILTNRLKQGLPSIILQNQSAFLAGRDLVENVLLTQEIGGSSLLSDVLDVVVE